MDMKDVAAGKMDSPVEGSHHPMPGVPRYRFLENVVVLGGRTVGVDITKTVTVAAGIDNISLRYPCDNLLGPILVGTSQHHRSVDDLHLGAATPDELPLALGAPFHVASRVVETADRAVAIMTP